MKRQRGRGRKPGNPSNRSFESNGPDVKIRGTASQIHEKYLQLARDASSAGDRVRAEALYQHAEHYFRILQANQPPRREGQQGEHEDGQQQGENQNPQHAQDGQQQGEGRDPMEVVTPEGGEMTPTSGEGEDDKPAPRRRTRRSRRTRNEGSEGSTEAAAPATGDAQAALDTASAAADEPKSDSSESEAA